ncbi:hypothetical protein GGF39_001531 [Coemansia sp. RSA 1721]|nr:hypothetical protein GGF39_001531 [Coemansia sp. RSA 1721]
MPLVNKLCCWLAAAQAAAVIGLETAIFVYVLRNIDGVFNSWSSDKGIAIYFLLLVIAAMYGVFLLVGGVMNGDTIQIIGFCAFNLFAMSLGIFRFFQIKEWLFYKFKDAVFYQIRSQMIASVCVMAGVSVVFGVMSYFWYTEFGWEIYKRVGADMKIRRMYINYRALVLLLKMDFFVFVGFAVTYIILILKTNDPEFGITVAFVPMTLTVLTLAFWALRKESVGTMWVFVFLLCGSTAYFVFKCARMYDPKQEAKFSKQRPMMTYYTVVSLVVIAATLQQAVTCLANFGYGLKERIEITRGKRSDMEQIQDYYVNAAGDRRMNLEVHLLAALLVAATSVAAKQTHVLFPRADNDTKAAEDDDDGGPKVDVSQMDLLSGIPAGVALLVGVIQVWPSPVQVCRRHLQEFLVWLKQSVERDFCVTLYSCERSCHSNNYVANSESVKSRIEANVGIKRLLGCLGTGDITVEELVDVIQNGDNGVTLDELARVARYPRMKDLGTAIKILRFSPSFGKRVIFFQWMGVGFAYFFNWFFRNGLPQLALRFLRFLYNVLRRIIGHPPIDYSTYRNFGLSYQMAELASHKVVSEHIPWVKYTIYFMLMRLAGRHLTTKVWGVDDINAGDIKTKVDLGEISNEDNTAFSHPMLAHRRLVMLMTTDECAMAKALYLVGIHSTRMLLLCRGVGFPPPHVITGSFKKVSVELEKTIIVFRHPRLDSLYKLVYSYKKDDSNRASGDQETQDYLHLCYDLMLKRLQSELGDMVTGQFTLHVLINMELTEIHPKYIEQAMDDSPRKCNIGGLTIEGVELDEKLEKALCKAHVGACTEVNALLESFLTPSVYWGNTVWLLYSFYQVSKHISRFKPEHGVDSGGEEGYSNMINELIIQLINSPFQTFVNKKIESLNRDGVNEDDTIYTSGELRNIICNRIALKSDTHWNSAPMWCVCSNHCRGVCTLLINETVMAIYSRRFFATPYFFELMTFDEKDDQIANRKKTAETPENSRADDSANIQAPAFTNDKQFMREPVNDIISLTIVKEKQDDKRGSKGGPVPVNPARLVCLNSRNLLVKNLANYRVERIIAAPSQAAAPDPSAAKSFRSAINLRHRSSHVNYRINPTTYALSTLLLENTPQLIVVLGNAIYTMRPLAASPEDDKKWAFSSQHEKLAKWFNDGLDPRKNINPVLPLMLDPPDKFTQQVTKAVGMAAGRLQYIRRQRRDDIYELDLPVRSITVGQ